MQEPGGDHRREEDAQKLREDFVKETNPSNERDGGEVQGGERVGGDLGGHGVYGGRTRAALDLITWSRISATTSC
eukprot:3186902-Heterocapsa_arctica.AAC.2